MRPQGDPSKPDSTIERALIREKLLEFFELDIDLDVVGKSDMLSTADLTPFLTEKPTA